MKYVLVFENTIVGAITKSLGLILIETPAGKIIGVPPFIVIVPPVAAYAVILTTQLDAGTTTVPALPER